MSRSGARCGSFHWAPHGREPGKNRPVIVISVDEINTGIPDELLVVVPVSSTRTVSPLRPNVSVDEGVKRSSVAVSRGVRAVARNPFLQRLGAVKPETLAGLESAFGRIIGIETVPEFALQLHFSGAGRLGLPTTSHAS